MKIYLVGGAVRDHLLGVDIKDRDWVVVDSSAEEMLSLGYQQVGADFPVFLQPGSNEEFALARTERKSGDGYLGFSVNTEGVTLEEDLSRRDLTINAMACEFHPTDWGGTMGTLIDPFNGQEDLKNKVLRHTSEAFAEDPLRVVRLARFASRYSEFSIAKETEDLAIEMIATGQLNHLSYERFWAEITKVFNDTLGCPARFFKLLFGWKAREHVTFFGDVFGDTPADGPYRTFISKTAVAIRKHLPSADRMFTFVGIVAKPNFTVIKGATVELLKLHGNIQALRKIADFGDHEGRVNATYELMKKAKPWGEGPHYTNLINAIKIVEMNSHPVLCSHRLEMLRTAVCAVKAEQFPRYQGKELGQVIDAARKLAVENQL